MKNIVTKISLSPHLLHFVANHEIVNFDLICYNIYFSHRIIIVSAHMYYIIELTRKVVVDDPKSITHTIRHRHTHSTLCCATFSVPLKYSVRLLWTTDVCAIVPSTELHGASEWLFFLGYHRPSLSLPLSHIPHFSVEEWHWIPIGWFSCSSTKQVNQTYELRRVSQKKMWNFLFPNWILVGITFRLT